MLFGSLAMLSIITWHMWYMRLSSITGSVVLPASDSMSYASNVSTSCSEWLSEQPTDLATLDAALSRIEKCLGDSSDDTFIFVRSFGRGKACRGKIAPVQETLHLLDSVPSCTVTNCDIA